MKKVTAGIIISFIMLIGLCACGGKGDAKCVPNLSNPFCVTAEIDHDGTQYNAVFTKHGKANWDVEFSAPDTLAGVLISFRDANAEASYKGLSFSVPKSALPLKSIISAFIDSADKTAELGEITGKQEDSEIITEGETELGKYTMKFDTKGCLTGFEMPNLNLVIVFKDFSGNIPETTAATEMSETSGAAEAETAGEAEGESGSTEPAEPESSAEAGENSEE
ncbi:MAG: hypothetical protein ACI4JB_02980 [Porcipelethomonas sp.]